MEEAERLILLEKKVKQTILNIVYILLVLEARELIDSLTDVPVFRTKFDK